MVRKCLIDRLIKRGLCKIHKVYLKDIKVIFTLLSIICFVLSYSTVWAKSEKGVYGYLPQKIYDTLQQKGVDVFQSLAIEHYTLSQKNTSFSFANVTWVFQKSQGFSALLNRLKQSQTIFQRVTILPRQLILNASLKENIEVLLWISQEGDDAFSGRLNVLSTQPQDTNLKAPIWIPEQARILMDIESYQPFLTHQWIYLLPLEQGDAWIPSYLSQEKWQKQLIEGQSVWHRGNERLSYHVNTIDNNMTLYVMKQRFIEE